MNPVFVFLVLLAAVILWFLLTFMFVPLGKILSGIIKDAIDVMKKGDEKKEKENV